MERRARIVALLLLAAVWCGRLEANMDQRNRSEAAPPLREAIRALTQEAESAMKGVGGLRGTCDYFTDPPEGVTAADLLALLKSKQHARVEIDCYVRWQLLSALPKRVEVAETQQLLSLLRSAPRLPQRPGLDATTQGKLYAGLQGIKFEQLDAANQRVAAVYADFQRGLSSLIHYRNELLRRCQPTRETVAAAIDEFQVRVKLGIEITNSCRSTLFPLVRDFAIAEGKPDDLARLGEAIRGLCYSPAPRWVVRLKWDQPSADKEVIWASSALNDGDANDMVAELRNIAAAGLQSGKLKLKQ